MPPYNSVPRACLRCGAAFSVTPSASAKGRGKLCSVPCRQAHSALDRRIAYEQSVVVSDDGCWGWSGSSSPDGYGRISKAYAHRVSWEMHRGPIPTGARVLHHCDNPPCSNPDHLFLGTAAENSRDMASKGRSGPTLHLKGVTTLPAATVANILTLRAEGRTFLDIGRELHIGRESVSRICRGVTALRGT